MKESRRVPAESVEFELVVNRSRFLTTIRRAPTVPAARAAIAERRQALPAANHHVYAFIVGHGNSVTEGMSDDGEPTGTAGPPTLAVLRGADIGDIALITTRYFGGIKLGTGGLVRAYSQAAKGALAALRTELKVERQVVGLELPYALYASVKRLIAEYAGTVEDEEFGARVLMIVRFVAADLPPFAEQLRELSAGAIAPVPLD